MNIFERIKAYFSTPEIEPDPMKYLITGPLGDVTEFKHKGRTFVLLKPSTFMNLSGKAVNYWMQDKKIKPENLLVIVDDMNLDFGGQRLKSKGSHGGHNGLKDIERVLGTSKYPGTRIIKLCSGYSGSIRDNRYVPHHESV